MVCAMPRPRSSSSGPFDSFELTLSNVYLVTSDREGELTVPGLGVVVDQLGLTVTKPDGSVGAILKWGDLRTVQTGSRMTMPSGTPAVVVEAVSERRTHRFVVPTTDPEGLEGIIVELAAARRSSQGADESSGEVKSSRRDRWLGRRH